MSNNAAKTYHSFAIKLFEEESDMCPLISEHSKSYSWVYVSVAGEVIPLSITDLEGIMFSKFPGEFLSKDTWEVFKVLYNMIRTKDVDRCIQSKDVASVAFKSTPGLCYRRLDFDPDPSVTLNDIPEYADIVTRCRSGGRTLSLFIGSIFYPNADRSQYLHISGSGGEGKTSLMNCLVKAIGHSSCHFTTSRLFCSDIGGSNLAGKALIVFPDENSTTFTSSGAFKSYVGGDFISTKVLYKGIVTVPVCGKIFIASNHKLKMDLDNANKRRVLAVEIDPLTVKADEHYAKRLQASFARVIQYTYNLFTEYAKSAGVTIIPPNEDTLEAIKNNVDITLEGVFEEFLEIDADANVLVMDLTARLRAAKISQSLQRQLGHLIVRKTGNKPRQLRLGEGSNRRRFWVYEGVKFAPRFDKLTAEVDDEN